MLADLKFEVGIVLGGGAAMLDHPAPAENEQYASAWRTRIQRMLNSAPGAQRIAIQQWRYGAAAVKPTTIRVLGLPPSAKHLHDQGDTQAVKPANFLAGVDETTGQFRTAQAKEYPSGLCRALVITLFRGLALCRRRDGVALRSLSQLGERDGQWLRNVAKVSHEEFAISATGLIDFSPSVQNSTGLSLAAAE